MFHRLPRQTDTFRGQGVKDRGVFKADKAAARIDGGHGGDAGAIADVSYHLAGPGIGFNGVLAQLPGFLRGMDGTLYRGKSQKVSGKAQTVLRSTAGTKKFSIVGTVAPIPGDFLIGLSLFKLGIRVREILVEWKGESAFGFWV